MLMKGFLNTVRQLQANDWLFLEITEAAINSNSSQTNIHFDINVRRIKIKPNLYCLYVLWNNEPLQRTNPYINKKIILSLTPSNDYPDRVNRLLNKPIGLMEAYILSKSTMHNKILKANLAIATYTWENTDDYWNNWQKAVRQGYNG